MNEFHAIAVIPTYNEAENIRRIVPRVLEQALDLSVLVVDDNSPDGTGAVAEEMGARDPRVHVLHRPGKAGLGLAYHHGLRTALELGFDVVIQMDADGSHDPADLPRLLEALVEADLVLGSRYLGGVRVIDWPISRLLLSIGANTYVRRIAGLDCTDCTTGYRAWKAPALERILDSTRRTTGYAFLVEMLYLAVHAGLRVKEARIVFTERRIGRTSLTRAAFLESMVLPWRLRLGRARRNLRTAAR